MVHTPKVEQVPEGEATRRLSFAAAAMGAAGHEITDPHLLELAERQV